MSKRATMAGPSPDSRTSARRKNRGFVSLVVSSRKHRRAARRSALSRLQYGKVYEPGDKVTDGAGTFVHTAGGSIRYHSS